MRTIPARMEALLDGRADFIGQNAPISRLTVVPDWWLNTEIDVGNWPPEKTPLRWWQRADGGLVEVEIPNLRSVDYEPSNPQTPAGTATFTVDNQRHDPNENVNEDPFDRAGDLGTPGYYSAHHGESPEAQARWGHTRNAWYGVLEEGALLHLYQGYGPRLILDGDEWRQKTIAEAVADGDIVGMGWWFVDKAQVATSGDLQLTCRDDGKLLVDQKAYPPLYPPAYIPTSYCRWLITINNTTVSPVGAGVGGDNPPPPAVRVQRRLVYADSSADRWYGFNVGTLANGLHGHRPADSVDGNPETFGLSVGNSSPERPFACDFFEYDCGEPVNAIELLCWGGLYDTYVSILENGAWVDGGFGNIFYDLDNLCETQTCVDTGAAIPYVVRTGVPWEAGITIPLPRTYQAQRIRVSFRNHTASEWDPWFYRCGIREIHAVDDPAGAGGTGQAAAREPFFYGIEPSPPDGDGYLVVAETGQQFAFGDARTATGPAGGNRVCAIIPTPTGNGYWTLERGGKVTAYGDAVHHGNAGENFCNDMACTPSGNGYWVIAQSGRVWAFGDAVHLGQSLTDGHTSTTGFMSIESHPSTMGYWVLHGSGRVDAYGLPDHGEIVGRARMLPSSYASRIRRTSTGAGYWVLTVHGLVAAFGDAAHYGEISDLTEDPEGTFETSPENYNTFRRHTWGFCRAPDDDGYRIMRGNGEIVVFGNAVHWGQPGGPALVRSDGNMLDWSDPVKDIALWSGFWLYEENPDPAEPPRVHGNIEFSGAYPNDCLPTSMFDKKAPIDPIKEIAEILGFLVRVDFEGALHFESPNIWQPGNFLEDGTYTATIPEIDERENLFDFDEASSDAPLRSELIVSTEEPTQALDTTVTSRLVPPTATKLRGMVKPSAAIHPSLSDPDEQAVMLELTALRIWFASRQGRISCVFDPRIEPDTQVRVMERQTASTYVHYVRAMHVHHDLPEGPLTMDLTTNWMGTVEDWAIVGDHELTPGGTIDDETPSPVAGERYPISTRLRAYLAKLQGRHLGLGRLDSSQPITHHSVNPPSAETGAATP